MRRADREVVGIKNILAILDQCEVMRLGLCDGNQPYVVPMNFGYEVVGEVISIYFHCATEGRKMEIIIKNNRACFEVDCSYQVCRDDIACAWTVEYQSVIGEGNIEILTDKAQKAKGLDLIMKQCGFKGKPEYNAGSLSAVTVLKLTVKAISGKQNSKKA